MVQAPRSRMPPYIAPETGALVGFWGKPTSTLDWCEENYVWTYYIAEFWNTLSNASMIVPALVGIWSCRQYHLETRYLLCYLGLLLVGVGSFLFHGTLLYGMQLLDELPMLYGSSLLLYTMYEMGQIPSSRSRQTSLTTALLILYPTAVSLVYIFIKDPTFHEVAYALMVIAITIQSFYCLKKYNSWKYLYFGLSSFAVYVFGFTLWNIDNRLCPQLRDYRKTLPSPMATMTQFHAWWHLFAGFGTYLQCLLSSRVRMEHLKYPCSLKFVFGVPYLEVGYKKTPK